MMSRVWRGFGPSTVWMAVGVLVGALALATPVGATTLTVDNGTADVTATGDGQLTIVLTDTAVNPTAVIENISGLTFSVAGGGTVGAQTVNPTSVGDYITVAADGSGDFQSVDGLAQWLFSGSGAQYTLSWAGGTQPAYTIIGLPGADGYTNANGSITGNENNWPPSHQPFIYETATFVINGLSGVTTGSDIGDLVLYFGTSWSTQPPTVPEPGTMLLLGSGLVGLAGWGRKWARR